MAEIPLANGESVWHADAGSPQANATISGNEASNLANLMGRRQRFDFVWASAAARNSQAGMRQGSRGYQVDTKTEWLFDSGDWRLAIPYIEFSGSTLNIGSGGYKPQGSWSVDTARSTDTGMASASGNAITFAEAGVYIISITSAFETPANADQAQFQVITTSDETETIAIGGYTAKVSTITTPYRIAAQGTQLFVWAQHDGGSQLTKRTMRIVRVG